MTKQPDGLKRVSRGERKEDAQGNKLPPAEYDVLLEDGEGDHHLGITRRLPKNRWKVMSALAVDSAQEFSTYTAAARYLLDEYKGRQATGDAVMVDEGAETAAILTDEDTMAAVHEGVLDFPDGYDPDSDVWGYLDGPAGDSDADPWDVPL